MLRTLIFYALTPLVTIVASCIALISGRAFGDRIGNFAQRLWTQGTLIPAGVKIEADLSALDPARNYVFMANHQSNFDIPVLSAALNHWSVRMVAKESLFKIPLFGPAMRRVGHVSVDRTKSRKAMQAIQEAVDIANSGISMVIFPEGTRGRDLSRIGEFKIGGFILALKTGLPVAPIVITGTGDIAPKGGIRIRPGTVKVKALPPVDPGRYSLKERERFKEDLHEAMTAAYLEMRNGG